VVSFFSRAAVRHGAVLAALQRAAGACPLIGCSTAGEIGPHGSTERGLVALALRWDQPRLRSAAVDLAGAADSAAAGRAIARGLAAPDLASVLVFAPGNDVDGAALTDALCDALGPGVDVFGGLAGDGGTLIDGPAAGLGAQLVAADDDGLQTWTLLDGVLATRRVVALGWYGQPALAQSMHSGALSFGPLRASRAPKA
jgi:FIST N domain